MSTSRSGVHLKKSLPPESFIWLSTGEREVLSRQLLQSVIRTTLRPLFLHSHARQLAPSQRRDSRTQSSAASDSTYRDAVSISDRSVIGTPHEDGDRQAERDEHPRQSKVGRSESKWRTRSDQQPEYHPSVFPAGGDASGWLAAPPDKRAPSPTPSGGIPMTIRARRC